MRRVLFILAVFLTQASLVSPAPADPKILSRDGSLVIDNPGAKPDKKNSGSEDTLYELLGQEVQVFRNDKITVEEALALAPEAIVISPGPCTPTEAGVSCELILAAAG